ncbi:MAG: hypothetical protein KBG48_27420 [Kofleriaceae bacterium]|jgi:hypothetical protein|nr:hypothetical protein [Kofleriaceae bacterium]MBP9171160.1 hypothetical protein [Kofleriaceae bacterium]MBP9861903.1 hypothetical protein [Kofleriaceae bacterium]
MRLAAISLLGLVVTGCSDGAPAEPGADAAVDARVIGPIGPVTVVVTTEPGEDTVGAPVAGVEVYFLGVDGAWVMQATDLDGRATAEVEAGSTALVVRPVDGGTYATAYLDLVPGMEVHAGSRTPSRPRPTNGGEVEVALTAPQAQVLGDCIFPHSVTPGIDRAPFDGTCPRLADAMIVQVAYDDAGVIGYSTVAGVDHTTTSAVTMPAALSPPTRLAIGYRGLPSSFIAVNASARTDHGLEALSFGRLSAEVDGPDVDGMIALAPVGDRFSLVTMFGASSRPPLHYLRRAPTVPTTLTIDVGAQHLGHNSYPRVSRTAPTPVIAWTNDPAAPGRRADVAYARGQYQGAQGAVYLRVLGDGARTELALPALPPPLAGLTAREGSASFNILIRADLGSHPDYASAARDFVADATNLTSNPRSFPAEVEAWYTDSSVQ